ncbi:MAG: TonB-dependent receptor plug domain-containing protein, partial [Bacteroidota bacterium]
MKKNVFYLKAALLSLILHSTVAPFVQAQQGQTGVASKEIILSGKVTDESGSPLAGVTVQVKDGKTLAATDNSGNFTVSVKQGTVLQFNSSGFAGYEYTVINAGSLSVKLTIANTMLDDIVIVGYGAVRKKDLTGSVSSVKAADIVRSPAHNALEALQGQVPGLDITRNSGRPTSGITMNIRGKRSLSTARDESNNLIANNPLVIIDGVQGGNIADIPPQDIESIDVMKDAASTAIYGYQGANGVIIVTTKRGKPGKQRISYNGYVGFNGWAQYPKMLTGDGYIQLRREASRTAGQWTTPANDASLFTAEEWLAIQNGQWTDWVNEVNHVGIVQNHQVTVSGGSVKTTGLLSAGYYREKGSLKDDILDKFNFRIAVDHNFSDIFKAGASANLTYYKGYERADNALWRAATNVPLGNAYDSLGRVLLFPLGTSGKVNPLADEASEFIAKHQRL